MMLTRVTVRQARVEATCGRRIDADIAIPLLEDAEDLMVLLDAGSAEEALEEAEHQQQDLRQAMADVETLTQEKSALEESVEGLQGRVAELEAENARLRAALAVNVERVIHAMSAA